MSRVLFDHNVPAPLRRYLIGHQVRTADQEGWGQISNGALISFAENAGYEVLLTCDQNLGYQQNLSSRKISLVVLGSNIWPGVKPAALRIADAVSRALPGSFEFIEITLVPK